jgi:ABC-type phosphate transport system permease subunit
MALGLLSAFRSQRQNEALVSVIVAATSTLFLMFLLLVLASVFRTYSNILYRRSRPLVFTLVMSPPPPPPPDDKSTVCAILEALLLLLSVLVLAAIVGVDFS